MADQYIPDYDSRRGPSYDSNDRDRERRGSYPNRTRQAERDRPPPTSPSSLAPMRSSSDADPRRMGSESGSTDNKGKRNASRSPKGGLARKHQKPEAPRGAGIAPSDSSVPRHSSMSHSTARQSGVTASSPSDRRTSAQSSNALKNPANGPAVASPSHSGRSTPQQRSNGQTIISTLQQAPDAYASNLAAPDTDTPLNTLMSWSTHIATRASLQFARDKAQARSDRAHLEFNEGKSRFAAFPAIKERKVAERDSAHRDFKSKAQKLDEHLALEQPLMGTFASLIGQLAAPKAPTVPAADLVSRADFELLQKDYQDMKQELDTTKLEVDKTKQEVSATKEDVTATKQGIDTLNNAMTTASKDIHNTKSVTGQVQTLQRDIDNLKTNANDLVNFKSETETTLSQVKTNSQVAKSRSIQQMLNLQQEIKSLKQDMSDQGVALKDLTTKAQHDDDRVTNVTSDCNAIDNDLKKVKDALKDLTTKAQHDDLVSECNDLKTKHLALNVKYETLEEGITAARKEIKQLSSKETNASTSPQQASQGDAISSQLAKDFMKLSKEQEQHMEKVENLSRRSADYEKKVDNLETNEGALSPVVDDLKHKMESVIEDPRDLDVKLDQKTHDDSVHIDALNDRIEQVTADIVDIKSNIIEEAKESMVKRIKYLDMLVNNALSEVKGNSQRISQLELDHDALQKDVYTVKTNLRSEHTPIESVDIAPLAARMLSLEGEVDTIKTEHSDRDNVVFEQIDEISKTLHKEIEEMKLAQEKAVQDLGARLQQSSEETQTAIAGKVSVDDFANVKGVLEQIDKLHKALREDLETLKLAQEEEVRDFSARLQQSSEDTQTAIAEKVSADDFAHVKGVISPLQDEVKKLQDQLHKAKSAPNTLTPTQLPNGANASLQANGVQQYPVNGQAHPPPAPHYPQEMQRLQSQLNQLITVTQHLKQRLDNQQTDDVVHAMVNQLSTLYPEAKNFEATTSKLMRRVDNLEKFRSEIKLQLDDTRQDSNKKAAATQSGLDSVLADMQELSKLKEHVDASAAEVEVLRGQLDDVSKIANDADQRSKQQLSWFSNLKPDARFKALEEQVRQHVETLSSGGEKFGEIQSSISTINTRIEGMKKRVAADEGKIQTLEARMQDVEKSGGAK